MASSEGARARQRRVRTRVRLRAGDSPSPLSPGPGTESTMEENNRRDGGQPLTEAGAAASNADLWAVYLRESARRWVDPFGLANPATVETTVRPFADLAASAMSAWLSIFVARPPGALYGKTAPAVNKFVAEQAIDPEAIEIPAQFTVVSSRPSPPPAPTQTEEWAFIPPRPREPALTR